MSPIFPPNPAFSIRKLGESDFGTAEGIFAATFPTKYHLEFLDAWKLRDSHLSLGAFAEEGRLVGFALVCFKDGGYRVEFLGVDPGCQKGGFGTILLRHFLELCKSKNSRATLIPVNDQRIIQWYKKHGFQEKGEPFVSPYTGDIEQIMEFSYTAAH